jgi:hypothetical protein
MRFSLSSSTPILICTAKTPTTPRSILKRKPSHPTTVPTTPVSKKKIKFESPDNSTAVETKCLTPESPFPQPFSTPVALLFGRFLVFFRSCVKL